tara:strand:- start:68 stop:616 length:549 start_codon:yes stop_codon:yes gene_type:complete
MNGFFVQSVYDSNNNFNVFNLCIFSFLIYVIAVIDLRNLFIPNKLIVASLAIGFLNLLMISFNSGNYQPLLHNLLSCIIGFTFLELLIFVLFLFTGKYAFGSGDSKFYSVIGAWLGLKGLIVTVMISFYLGALFCLLGLLSKRLTRKDQIPFAPFISFAAYAVAIFGSDEIIDLFSSLNFFY